MYDHAQKVGNKGDVWKHFILLTVLQHLIDHRKDESTTFFYFDSHCGQGLYTLGAKGAWRSGIGQVQQNIQNLSDHPYFQILELPLATGSSYFGSWLLVNKFLQSRQISSTLELCDTSSVVAKVISTQKLDEHNGPDINFHQANGFDELQKYVDADLILIDPPYFPDADKDWKKSLQSIELLRPSGTAFLIWYPIFWMTKPANLVKAAGVPGFEVLWSEMGQKPSQNQKGCGVLAGGYSNEALRMATDQLSVLAMLLGGKYFVREP